MFHKVDVSDEVYRVFDEVHFVAVLQPMFDPKYEMVGFHKSKMRI
jgi:hypothetical protein